MIVKVVVTYQGFEGFALYPCILDVTEEQYKEGNHYEIAKKLVFDILPTGFDPSDTCDENDEGFPYINWDKLVQDITPLTNRKVEP